MKVIVWKIEGKYIVVSKKGEETYETREEAEERRRELKKEKE